MAYFYGYLEYTQNYCKKSHWSYTGGHVVKKFNFTQARIKELPAPDKGRLDYYDTEVTKLVCRVSSTGNKSFLVSKRVDGKLKNVTIGKFSDVTVIQARKIALTILSDLNSGIDPTAVKRKNRIEQTPLADVLELYVSDRDLKPYTVKDYRYKLELGFSDWLHKPVNSLTEDMVLNRYKKVSQVGKTTANTTMRVLRLTLNYALAIGMIDSNPTTIISRARLWHKNNRKDRVIHSNQLKVWHDAVEDLDNQKAKVYLLMCLYMGYRSSELLGLKWEHVDLMDRSITIFDTKNRTNHKLPIPTILLPYIESLRLETGQSIWVFAGTNPAKPMSVPTKPIRNVALHSGVTFSPHDCRRTFATVAEAVNLPMSMIKRLMNHITTNDVTGGYIVTEDETLRRSINKIADFIYSKVTEERCEVGII